MSARWWAPEQAGIGPDSFDLALLEPGGDASLDLGSALIALHRLGAAACEAVAEIPLASEQKLVGALAMARTSFADPMVDAVSKAVGTGSYAGLLTRDVFDDAERGALDLFRIAVAKGVAPPLAVRRVGAVYGLPRAEMGRYAELASTPGANQVALDDAADRALFDYLARFTAAELPAHQDQVAKAVQLLEPQTQTSGSGVDWRENQHPRDQHGLFTRVATAPAEAPTQAPATVLTPGLLARFRAYAGRGQQQAPEVAGATQQLAPPKTELATETTTVTATPAPKRKPKVRQVRQVRQTRKTSTRPATESVVSTEVAAESRPKLHRTLHRSLNRELLQPRASQHVPRHAPKPDERDLVDAMAKINDKSRGEYYSEDVPLTFVLDETQQRQFQFAAYDVRGEENASMFRIGHLADLADHKPEINDSDEHLRWISHIVREEDESGITHITQRIPRGEMKRIPPEMRNDYLEAARHRMVQNVQDQLELHDLDPKDLFRLINAFRVYGGTDDDWVIVFSSATAPLVHEYAMDSPGPYGAHQLRQLDPNSIFIARGDGILQYDETLEVVRNTLYLEQINEQEAEHRGNKRTHGNVGKTLETAERTQFAQLHPRNQHGQFTDVLSRPTLVAPTAQPVRHTVLTPELIRRFNYRPATVATPVMAKPKPRVRQVRQVRRKRASVTAPVQSQTATEAPASKPLDRQQLHRQLLPRRLTRKLAEATEAKSSNLDPAPGAPTLRDAGLYHVYGVGTESYALPDPLNEAFWEANYRGRTRLSKDSLAHLTEEDAVGGPLLDARMRWAVEEQVSIAGSYGAPAMRTLSYIRVDDQSVPALVDYLDTVLETNQNVSLVNLEKVPGAIPAMHKVHQFGEGGSTYRVLVNAKKTPALHVIEWDQDAIYAPGPRDLVLVGEFSSRQLGRNFKPTESPMDPGASPYDAPLMVYRIERA